MAHLPFPRSRGQPGTPPGLDCCHALRNISVTLLLSLKCLQTKPHTRFAAQKARVWCGFHVCVSSTGRSVSIPGPLLPAGRAGAAGLHPAGRLLVTTAEAGRPSRSGVSDGSISAHVCLCARARGGGGGQGERACGQALGVRGSGRICEPLCISEAPSRVGCAGLAVDVELREDTQTPAGVRSRHPRDPHGYM